MSEDLSLKFDIASEDAVAGVDAVNTALGKTKAVAAEASAGLTGMESATKTLQAALDKLAASDGPRGMIKNAALAQVALEQYKASAIAAGVSTSDMAAKVQAAGTQIQNAADKVGILRKAQADLGAQGAMTGSQLDKLRMSGTSLMGLFDSMERTGVSPLTKAIGAMGVSVGIAGIAFAGAKALGEELGKVLGDLVNKHSDFMTASEKVALTTQKYTDAQRLLAKGLIETSDSVDGLIANYDRFVLASGRGSDAMKKQALGFTDVQMAALSLGQTLEKTESMAAALTGQIHNTALATEDLSTKTTALTLERMKNQAALDAGNVTGAAASDIVWREGLALDAVVEAEKKATTEQFKLTQEVILAEPQLRAQEAAYRSLGQAVPEATRAAIEALDAMKKKQDEATEAMKRAMEVAKNLPAAMQNATENEKKFADAAKLVADAHDKVVPSIMKVLEAVGQGKMSFDAGSLALAEYAREHKLTAEAVVQMAVEQGRLAEKMNTADAAMANEIAGLQALGGNLKSAADDTRTLSEQTAALGKLGDAVNKSIDQRNASIDAGTTATADYAVEQDRLNKAIAEGSLTDDDIGRRMKNIDMMKNEAEAAKNAADAFGNLASSFGQVSMQADKVASGLQGVAWEMRSATPVTVTLNDSQNALVESLAKVADQYGKTSLWVEHLLSQFEKGTVSLADFRKQLADMLIGMKAMPDAFGDTSVQMNIMLALLDKFKNTASNGWPVTTTTAPYAVAP